MISHEELMQMTQDAIGTQEELEKRRGEMITQASRVLNQNQECYVAQWIMHNRDVDFNEYQLSFKWREDGFGYNVFMVKKGEEV